MKSRAARLALLVLFVMALGVTAYLFRKSETGRRAEATAAESFNAKARVAARDILELRAAQQAYVATGQGEDFWAARVASALARLHDGLTALRASAGSAEAQVSVETAIGSLQDFSQMDVRARDYVRTGQKVLASDLIFSNGTELTQGALAAIDKAIASEQLARAAAGDTFASRQNFALIAAAAAAGLVVLLLLPRVEPELLSPSFLEPSAPVTAPAAAAARKVGPAPASHEGWSAPRRVGDPLPAAAAGDASSSAETPTPPALVPGGPSPVFVPAFDFKAVAALCTELSRVDDTMALPPLLERAATLLNAAGIILWIADPDGRELNPVLAHGYPQHLVNRLGTIPRSAENATAAAFRTGMLQTVYADGSSNGAIAAPLVTCGGCVGVMAAEVRGDTEKIEANLAAATILAAQLASLVGPPAGRSADANIEAANA